MANFRVKAAAKTDLNAIAKFTEKTWGRKQRNKYITEFDHAFHQLAENSELGKSCDYIRTGYRVFPVGSHIIFYKIANRHNVEIIRVLHKRMNVSPRLFKA